jgi:sarcosine oxidase
MTKDIADVIVVGLGAFGSATAYQLAKLGANVIGIDQFAPPHDRGSSHGATRITRLAAGEGETYIPFIQRSHAIWCQLEQETGQSLYRRTGGLVLGSGDGTSSHHGKPDFVRTTIANARKFGIEHEVLSAADVRDRYSQFQTRGDEIAYFEHDAGVLFPERCIETQLMQAKSLGASIRLNERVLSIEQQGSGVTVRTTSGTYAAAKAILTAGPWLPDMADIRFRRNLKVMRQTLHWFEASDASAYSPEKCPIFIWMHGDGDQDYMYGFPMVDGKPGVKVATEQYETSCTPDEFDRQVSAAESRAMFDRHVEGRLASVTPKAVHSAACLYTVSTDSAFIVDTHRDMENVTVVSACSGHGFKNSAGVGERLAMWATARESSAFDAFRASRFD